MALGTYAQLKTSIVTWAMRTGDAEFEASTGDFITLAENLMNYGTDTIPALRTAEMEASDTLTLVDDEAFLPADFLEYRTVRYGDDYDLPGDDFSVVGDMFRTTRNGVSPIAFGYYSKIPALSDSNTTNWLLAKAPNVYLFGALTMAAPFMMDDPRTATWGTLYQGAISGLVKSDSRARFIGSTVRTAGYTP